LGIIEIILIGLGLSMDAVAVSVSEALSQRKNKMLPVLPVAFGLFQGIMPILGYYLGSVFGAFLEKYSGIVTLVILGIIGGKMIFDAFRGEEEKQRSLSLVTVLLEALATSIDAFAVGVSFYAAGTSIFAAAGIIAAVTFVCSMLAIKLCSKFSDKFGKGAQIAGGVVLILIGLKSLFF